MSNRTYTAAPGVSGSGKAQAAVFLLVMLICAAVYACTISFDFIYDDIILLKERSALWADTMFRVAFGPEGAACLGKSTPYYRPFLILSLAFDHLLWGTNPVGFHAVNLLLHLVATGLAFIVSRKILQNIYAAGITALVFAVHPVQAEAVSWISARGDILCLIFILLSFLAYIQHDGAHQSLYLAASGILFFAALLAKEMAITLPCILFFYTLCTKGRQGLWRLLVYVIPLLTYFALRLYVLPVQTWESPPLAWRLSTSVGILFRYLLNGIAPFDLRVFYDIAIQRHPAAWAVILPASALLAAAVATWLIWRRCPPAGFGLLWFFIALLPVSGIVTIIQPAPMADRYLYIPLFGLALAVGNAGSYLQRHRSSLAVCIALIMVMGISTFFRTADWRNQDSFTDAILRDAPHHYFAHYFNGQKLSEEGRLDEAVVAFSTALKLNPQLSEGYAGRGISYYGLGVRDLAAADFSAAIRLDRRNWRACTNLGVILAQSGQKGESAALFRKALSINPDDAKAAEYLRMVE